MTTESSSDLTITREALLAAGERAKSRLSEMGKELYSGQKVDGHYTLSHAYAAQVLVTGFLDAAAMAAGDPVETPSDTFSPTSFFDYILRYIAPVQNIGDSISQLPEQLARERNAATKCVLEELALYEQYLHYNRSQNQSVQAAQTDVQHTPR